MAWSKSAQAEHVRIGPISVLTLITVICIAVLAVLAITTSNATKVLTERHATATAEMYVDEAAAQAFVAETDARLAAVRASGGGAGDAARAVARDLSAMCNDVHDATGGDVEVSASIDGTTVEADFSCGNGRILSIELAIGNDASYTIRKWEMAAVQNSEQPQGTLWTGE